MITLSNDHKIEYVVASGSLAFDGLGWFWERPLVWLGFIKPELFTVVTKSLTRQPRAGNLRWWKPWTCIRLIPGGAVNKVGLTNPGIEWWCREIGPNLDLEKYKIAVSIFGEEAELVEMAKMLNQFNLVGLEVNVSCPNTDHDLSEADIVINSVKAVKQVSVHPIILKLSVAQDYLEIVAGLADIVEAVSLNSVPWKMAFPSIPFSPLRSLGGDGGVSGRPAQECNWTAVRNLSLQGLVPVIGSSVMEFDDMEEVRELGAEAVSFGAIHFLGPWKPTSFIEKESKNEREVN
jgi:dihydroorotate dehydrogenase